MDAQYCWILRTDFDGSLGLAVAHEGPAGVPPRAAVDASASALLGDDDSVVLDLGAGELALLVARARYHGVQNGAICLARGHAESPWEATDRALAAGVGNHLGIAIAQIADHEALERLSRTDELTGLVNRRAFYDVVASRLNHLRRAGDLPARFGGDEFALWLEETDETSAIAKAKGLADCERRFTTLLGSRRQAARNLRRHRDQRPGGRSRGTQGADRDADEAMYRAKRAGKGGYVLVRATEWAEGESVANMEDSG